MIPTLLIPPSLSFGDDDIPSVMVECAEQALSEIEIALVGAALALATSESIDAAQQDNRTNWTQTAAIGALRGIR
jgi:hypothetical protein